MQFVKETSKNCELLGSTDAITWCVCAQQNLANTLRTKQKLNHSTTFSWTEFLTQIWTHQQNDSRVLLSDFETELIWEQIIKASNELPTYDSETKVYFTRQAWQYLYEWNLSLDSTGVFGKWAGVFQAKLREFNAITLVQIPDVLGSCLQSYIWPRKIILVGFFQFTPSQEKLFALLKQYGIEIQFENTNAGFIQGQLLESFTEPKQQYRTMAFWAKQILDKSDAKNIKIGCIIPKLADKYNQIGSAFTEIKIPFNIVGDIKFHTVPVVFHALHFLKFISNSEFYYQEITQFLLSPFLAGAKSEVSSRALLDFDLRKKSTHHTLHTLLALTKDIRLKVFSPILSDCIDKLLEINKKLPLKMSVKKWATVFEKTLSILGWPGEQNLSSEEFQLVERWQLLLRDFQKIDFLVGELDLPTALRILNAMAKKVCFWPLTSDQPILIVDLRDAYGYQFDHLWIADVNENFFVSQKNPFISLPFDDPQTFEKVLSAITRNAKNPIFSSVKSIDSVASHSLLRGLVHKNRGDDNYTPPSNLEYLFSQQQLETIEDNYAPQMQSGELRGAIQTFKTQAICPFKAVAQQRLHAQKIPRPVLGLDPMDRGIIVHHLMESIWRFLKESETLKTLSDDNLKNLIDTHVDKTLLYFIAKKPQVFKTRFLALEKQRLKKLIFNWLNYEKTRSNFKILSLETEKKIHLGDFNFNIRIDRIDELENGSLAIIDYKTAGILLTECFGERLTEPQLPIYYLFAHDTSIQALVFAQVIPKEMKFKGIAAEDELLPHVKKNYALKYVEDWSELKDFWQKSLLQTAKQITQGYAVADPINGKNTCQFCELKIMCRKNLYSCQSESENEDE